MKHLSEISLLNWKARTGTIPLRQLMAICGPNGSGKSAIVDAIKVALLGYHPRHGKQPSKTFGFAGNHNGATECGVTGKFSDGDFVSRMLKLKKSKVSQDDKFIRGAETSFVVGPMVPPSLLDAQAFLGLSGPAKVQFIFGQIDLTQAGFTTDAVVARLKTDITVETPTEASEKTLNAILDSVRELAEFRDHEKQTVQEWIDAIADHVKSQQAEARAIVNDMAGAIGATTQLRAAEGLRPGNSIASDLETARKTLIADTTVVSDLVRGATEYAARLQRKQKLESLLMGLPDQSEQIGKWTAEHEQGIEKLKGYRSATPDLLIRETQNKAAEVAAEKEIRRLTQERTDEQTELANYLSLDCCPTCKSKGESWKAALQEFVKAKIAGLEQQINQWTNRLDEAVAERGRIEPLMKQSKAADAAIDQLRAEHFALGQKITKARNDQQERDNVGARLVEVQDIGSPIHPDTIAKANAVKEESRTKVERLEADERQQIAATQDLRRSEQARQRHADKTIEVEVYASALKVLAALKVEIMEKAFGGFMDKINLFTDGIVPAPLAYRDGEIGYFAGATWVSMEYFSGTEQMMTYIGLCVAISQSSPIKIVFVDEWLRDVKMRMRVANRLAELISRNVIDQAIIIDTYEEGYPAFGYEIVRTGVGVN